VTATAPGYEYFEVEADVGIRAWGPDRRAALAQAALGALALVIDPGGVEETETREVRAQADTPETQLASFVDECLYVHEIEGFAVRRVEVDHLDGAMVHGVLHGEPIDPSRHRLGTVVKAATLHRIAVNETAEGVEVRLIVDV
jgi:SHS2 domain-containing protein